MTFFSYLPLAPGQKASHLPLAEGLGGFAGQWGERGHPGVGEGFSAGQPASTVQVDRKGKLRVATLLM